MRVWAVLALAAIALGGCSNMVFSEGPLFTSADAAAPLKLRPGVWAAPEADCAFDKTKPASTWPGCANATVVKRRNAARGLAAFMEKGDPLLVAKGDRMIVYSPTEAAQEKVYYSALRVARSDESGRALELRAWAVECGPPAPEDPEASGKQRTTAAPLPGLEMRDQDCIAREAATVRAAAKASEAWAAVMSLRWLRDGR